MMQQESGSLCRALTSRPDANPDTQSAMASCGTEWCILPVYTYHGGDPCSGRRST